MLRNLLTFVFCGVLLIASAVGIFSVFAEIPALVAQTVTALVIVVVVFTSLIIYGVRKGDMSLDN